MGAATSAWVPPEQFDEYRLVQALGRGGMGQVFLAHDTLLDRAVAVKFIAAVHRSEIARQRFLIEARAAARLSHPNVVLVHRVGELDGRPYLVSEFVRGQSLDKLRRPVAMAQLLPIAIGLCRGLAAAHRRGVLHRDIKPANAMLAETGEVKLLDFGLAKLFEGEAVPGMAEVRARASTPRPIALPKIDTDGDTHTPDADAHADAAAAARLVDPDSTLATPPEAPHARVFALDETATPVVDVPDPTGVVPAALGRTPPPLDPDPSPGVTVAGAIMGTPAYMSPEAWLGEPATLRSDVYSMGVVLYELAAGRSPHRADSLAELREAITERDPVPLAERVPGVDPRLAAIVDRCLARDPAARFPSAEELREALERIAAAPADRARASGNPYRGLATFEAEHAGVFFGRDGAIRGVIDRLRSDGFVLVAGDSGVGKSSLCRAGVAPRVVAGALDPARAFRAVTVLPGPHPVLALAAALAPVLEPDTPDAEAAIATALLDDPAALARRLRYRLGAAGGLLVFVDQLEELVTQADPVEAAAAAALLAAISERSPQLRLLATVRGDFLTRLARLPALAGELERAIYLLAPLGPEQIREAITGPAAATGVTFESTAMVDELVRATAAADGGLPLLQFALADLWDARDKATETITAASLDAIGGVAGALARHADATIAALLPDARAAARDVVVALVTADGTRARRTEAELGASPAVRGALDALVRARLVVARDDGGQAAYELAHDSLIVTWPTLQGWLRADAGDRALRDGLSRAATEWDRQRRPRDLLWAARRLATIADLPPASLPALDAAFVAASRRAARRRRLGWAALAAAIPAVAVAVYVATQVAEQRDLDRRVDAELAEARRLFESRLPLEQQLAEARAAAFAKFDADDYEGGEAAWVKVVELETELDTVLAHASQVAEQAVVIDSTRADGRELLADIIFARATTARTARAETRATELLERLAVYDARRLRLEQWSATGHVELRLSPPDAKVRIERWHAGTGQWEVVVPEAMGDLDLSPGSYRALVSAPTRHPVTYPWLLEPGKTVNVAVKLPDAGAVPAGFVVLPAATFLFGSTESAEQRTGYFTAAPMHQRSLERPVLIARHETTYAEWIDFLEALPSEARERHRPQSNSLTMQGSIELRGGPGAWSLRMQPTTVEYAASSGQPIRYRERSVNAAVEWERMPVSGVSRDDATEYSRWLDETARVPGARLCTEAEWEFAARGGDGRRFPSGDALPAADANTQEKYARRPEAYGPDEVGSNPRSVSPFDVHDLAGNVWDVTTTLDGSVTVARGGAFSIDRTAARSDTREVIEAGLRDPTLGVRICADLAQ